jgi:hypothetical protein
MLFFIVCIADSLSAVARRASQIPFRVSFSFALAFLASQCAFSYARVFLSAARVLTLSSDSKCALELKILCNSFSEAQINAVDFESVCFFGTFPKFAHPDAHFVRNCAPEISAAQYKLSSLVPHAIPTLHMCTSTVFESAT